MGLNIRKQGWNTLSLIKNHMMGKSIEKATGVIGGKFPHIKIFKGNIIVTRKGIFQQG